MFESMRRMYFSLVEFSKVFKKSDFKKCGNNVIIYYNSQIGTPENVEIEDDVIMAEGLYIDGRGEVLIKRGTTIGPNVSIYSSSHNYDSPDQVTFPFDETYSFKKVVIGEFCWIGRNSIILPGVTLGKGCVVGAGSVVTKDVEDFSIVAGNPARFIKKRDNQNIDDSTISWTKVGKEVKNFRNFIIK